ncbi:pentapeptide repeat-containing protein [Lentzea flaviverrucosa]|uniref:pentapeptide repeat-containing protein n=1 Tax=Lentzea flaviverrucosa TaxID=200379 RepID=UPI001476F3F2|nr:pentapeptide repeat-containing protein [Lentzea flaviverrucosa]
MLLVMLGILMVFGFLVVVLGPISQWATVGQDKLLGKERADAINATRQVLLAATGGSAVLVGLGFTARTYFLSKRGQLTDRYTKAIAQLASEKLAERLGGIYALDHLMRESEADHATVVAVLAAFIRENAAIEIVSKSGDVDAEVESEPRPRTDVQAALTVLVRRPVRPESGYIDLSNTDLRGADLRWARLQGAYLTRAWLQFANLSSADLKDSHLRGARLQHAWLVGAGLSESDLIGAELEQANLGGAELRGARLLLANLKGAHLLRADLSRSDLAGASLEGAYLVDARLDEANLAGGWISGRVKLASKGFHSRERYLSEDVGGACLKDAKLTRARLNGARLATAKSGRSAPVQDLTVDQLLEAQIDDLAELPADLRDKVNEQRSSK